MSDLEFYINYGCIIEKLAKVKLFIVIGDKAYSLKDINENMKIVNGLVMER